MKNKSIRVNGALYGVRTIVSVLLPIITTPYLANILQVENLGRYSFSFYFVNYFVLFAVLGTNIYAVREGAALRDDKVKLTKFVSEVFSINIVFTLFSYLFLFVAIYNFDCLSNCKDIILILSIQIFFVTIGVEWIFTIFEDYFYIALRSILFNVLSLILILLFVKNKNDVNTYACITVITCIGTNLWNYIKARKYCNVTITYHMNILKHIKPMFIMFGTIATIAIYGYTDNTLLGLLTSDYNVGLYDLSTKIYFALKIGSFFYYNCIDSKIILLHWT